MVGEGFARVPPDDPASLSDAQMLRVALGAGDRSGIAVGHGGLGIWPLFKRDQAKAPDAAAEVENCIRFAAVISEGTEQHFRPRINFSGTEDSSRRFDFERVSSWPRETKSMGVGGGVFQAWIRGSFE